MNPKHWLHRKFHNIIGRPTHYRDYRLAHGMNWECSPKISLTRALLQIYKAWQQVKHVCFPGYFVFYVLFNMYWSCTFDHFLCVFGLHVWPIIYVHWGCTFEHLCLCIGVVRLTIYLCVLGLHDWPFIYVYWGCTIDHLVMCIGGARLNIYSWVLVLYFDYLFVYTGLHVDHLFTCIGLHVGYLFTCIGLHAGYLSMSNGLHV